MNVPDKFNVTELTTHVLNNTREYGDYSWGPARPTKLTGFHLCKRVKLAWGVFTGKYDVVWWNN